MVGLSKADLVAAVANAGAFSCIASAVLGPEVLREEIRKTKSLTDKPFGVNISLFPMFKPAVNEEYIDIAIEEGVRVIETSGHSPEAYVQRIRRGKAKLMHKCARVRDARTAERVGADIVEVVGFECGGHPSLEEVTTLVLLPQVVDAVKIPVVGGGGFCDARGFVAALALGAEGVLMGTRFMAARECPIHPNFKDAFVNARETDTLIIQRNMGTPVRAFRNELALKVHELEQKGATLEDLMPLVGGERARRAWEVGDVDGGVTPCGQAVGLIHDIATVKELIDTLMDGVTEVYQRVGTPLGSAI
jgi:nitronate monooxygenase